MCCSVALEEVNGSIKPKLAANIEKARLAMSRLEEIFTQNPALQTTDVMRKLLEVYKDCRSVTLVICHTLLRSVFSTIGSLNLDYLENLLSQCTFVKKWK